MAGRNGYAASSRFTPEEDAEDFGRLVRETRTMQEVTVAELAARAGVAPEAVLDFEAGRVIPARPPFDEYMRALGFSI